MLRKIASEEDQKVARQCIDTLRKGNVSEIEARLDPSLKGADTHAALAQMAAMLPPGNPDAVKLVGANLDKQNDTRSMNLTYQYTWGQQFFLINCATRTQGERTRHLRPERQSARWLGRAAGPFRTRGKIAVSIRRAARGRGVPGAVAGGPVPLHHGKKPAPQVALDHLHPVWHRAALGELEFGRLGVLCVTFPAVQRQCSVSGLWSLGGFRRLARGCSLVSGTPFFESSRRLHGRTVAEIFKRIERYTCPVH